MGCGSTQLYTTKSVAMPPAQNFRSASDLALVPITISAPLLAVLLQTSQLASRRLTRKVSSIAALHLTFSDLDGRRGVSR